MGIKGKNEFNSSRELMQISFISMGIKGKNEFNNSRELMQKGVRLIKEVFKKRCV